MESQLSHDLATSQQQLTEVCPICTTWEGYEGYEGGSVLIHCVWILNEGNLSIRCNIYSGPDGFTKWRRHMSFSQSQMLVLRYHVIGICWGMHLTIFFIFAWHQFAQGCRGLTMGHILATSLACLVCQRPHEDVNIFNRQAVARISQLESESAAALRQTVARRPRKGPETVQEPGNRTIFGSKHFDAACFAQNCGAMQSSDIS